MKINRMCVLAFVTIIALAGSVRADSVFTTTGDFDAGTKAPTTDENLGIETTTDNPGIASGAFELGSLKGDSFNTASADANTAKWTPYSVGVCSSETRNIASGVLNLDAESVASCERGVGADAGITGDWDIRLKVDKTQDVGTINQWFFGSFNVANERCTTPTADGTLYVIVDGNLGAYKCVNSVFLQAGTNTAVPSDPVWLRMTRATNTYTWFYSTDGALWTQDEQDTDALIVNPGFPLIGIYADTPGEPTGADFDNFHAASGTVGAGGFRMSGIWTSASQSNPSPALIESATVTYTGASASNFITSFAVLDGVGATLFFDDANIVAGTSFTYTIPSVAPGANWKVRLNLTSGGAGTTTITEIAVITAVPPVDCFGTSTFGVVLFAIFGLVAGVSILGAIWVGLRSSGESMDPATVGALIVSVVVTLAIVGALLAVFYSAETIGC